MILLVKNPNVKVPVVGKALIGGTICFLTCGGADGGAFFFKVCGGSDKVDITVSAFKIFTLIPTCEFLDSIYRLWRQLSHIVVVQVHGSVMSTPS